MPRFVEPQLCKSVERPPQGAAWAHEIKFDGYRVQVRVEDGTAVVRTRKGLDWTHRFARIARDATTLPDCIIDGEVAALNANGSPDFAALQAALSDEKTDDLVLFAFDLLFARRHDLRQHPLSERKSMLKALLEEGEHIRFVDHFDATGDAVLKSACSMDLEGWSPSVWTRPYQSGRSESWTKAKCRAGHEVVLGGWTTTGDAFRSLIAGVYRDGGAAARMAALAQGSGETR